MKLKIRRKILKMMVANKRISPGERMATRIGYMGAGFLIAAQWTVEPIFYILGFGCILIQTSQKKQWNLAVLQVNGLVAWLKHFFTW